MTPSGKRTWGKNTCERCSKAFPLSPFQKHRSWGTQTRSPALPSVPPPPQAQGPRELPPRVCTEQEEEAVPKPYNCSQCGQSSSLRITSSVMLTVCSTALHYEGSTAAHTEPYKDKAWCHVCDKMPSTAAISDHEQVCCQDFTLSVSSAAKVPLSSVPGQQWRQWPGRPDPPHTCPPYPVLPKLPG